MRLLLTYIALLSLAIGGLLAQPLKSEAYEDRFLICIKPDIVVSKVNTLGKTPVVGIAALDQLMSLREIKGMERYLPSASASDVVNGISLANIYQLKIDEGSQNLQQLISDFANNESVLYAEKQVKNKIAMLPNDPDISKQWYLDNARVKEAWDLWDADSTEPGNRTIVLASVDTGVKYTHSDLSSSTWINQREVPAAIFDVVDTDADGYVDADEVLAYCQDWNGDGNVDLQDALYDTSAFMDGIDDDYFGSGAAYHVDDLFGWDVAGVTGGEDPDNDPLASTEPHGTHVAGLLAATTNNGIGMASAIFNGSIMSVKCHYDNDTQGYITGGYDGILYAAKAGADIINCSWGSFNSYNTSDKAVIDQVSTKYGAIVVASAGNGNDDGSPNNDVHYPSGYNNAISVTAVSPSDKFSWATYGSTVDISAPGENMYSTVFRNAYSYYWGTSMAGPFVGSCIGLLKSRYPDKSREWLIETILSSADPIDHINPAFAGGLGSGRVNIYNALIQSLYPRLSFDSYAASIVNDNGDGQLSPGEEARLRIDLFNAPGWANAVDVKGVLKSNSEFAIVVDSTGGYDTINSGEIGINNFDRYYIALADDAPTGVFAFTLEITANSATENPYSVTLDLNIEASMWQANFPLATAVIKSGNAIVDLDGDGSKEIIFGAADSLLHAVQLDGSELDGFPVLLNHRIEASPAVGDIDADGDLEVVIGSWDSNVYVVQHDGSADTLFSSASIILATSTLYDLDGDGDLEIISPTYAGDLVVLHHDGTPFRNFPVTLEGSMADGASVADINGDGNVEIIVGTWGNRLYVIDLDGNDLNGFPLELAGRVSSAPVVGNIDGSSDGSPEVLFSEGTSFFRAYDQAGQELWAYNKSSMSIQADPAISDLDGDGDLEIIFGGLDRRLYVLNHTGSLLPGWPVSAGGVIYGSPSTADLDGDGEAEVFAGSNDHFLHGLKLDGTNIKGFPVENSDKVQGAPSLAFFDGDSDIEIAFGTDDNLAVLDVSRKADLAGYWTTHRGNLHRTGALSSLPVSVVQGKALPEAYSLQANYPNPFNPSTRISFDLPEAAYVTLDILDIRGRVVETLVSDHLRADSYTVIWQGTRAGKPVGAGIYLYRLSTPEGNLIRKMTLLK